MLGLLYRNTGNTTSGRKYDSWWFEFGRPISYRPYWYRNFDARATFCAVSVFLTDFSLRMRIYAIFLLPASVLVTDFRNPNRRPPFPIYLHLHCCVRRLSSVTLCCG